MNDPYTCIEKNETNIFPNQYGPKNLVQESNCYNGSFKTLHLPSFSVNGHINCSLNMNEKY